MDIDYDIATMLIEEVIPYSLEYYLGIKAGEEGLYEKEEEEEDDDEDDEDDEKPKKS